MIFTWIRDHIINDGSTTPYHHREYMEWLQVYPPSWKDFFESPQFSPSPYLASSPQESQFSKCERVNYSFKPPLIVPPPLPESMTLVPVSVTLFNQLQGSVVPSKFWKDADTWQSNGAMGFCIIRHADDVDQPVSWAFSSGLIRNKLEIGIETALPYRGQGFARIVCTRLLQYCLEKGLEPIWCCRRTNVGSCKLALSLGFSEVHLPTGPIPYYHLPVVTSSPTSSLVADYRKC